MTSATNTSYSEKEHKGKHQTELVQKLEKSKIIKFSVNCNVMLDGVKA